MAKAETPKHAATVAASDARVSDARDVANIEAQRRTNLAAYHIQAAAALARQARRMELETAGRAFDNESNPVLWSVSAAVILAWAALEANINQLVKAFEDENAGDTGLIERCSFLYREPVVTKYKGLAKLKERELQATTKIFEDFEVLANFRNALVNFQPEWHDEEGRYAELCQTMRGIVKPPRGMPSDAAFPFCCLGYECAKWAVVTATGVSAQYATLISAEDQLAASWLDLETP